MNSTIPADLLELKARFETWRTNRKYVREPIPDELWNAAADLSRRYPPSLVGRVLKLDSSILKKPMVKRSARFGSEKNAVRLLQCANRDCIDADRITIYHRIQSAVGFKSNDLTVRGSR